MFTRNEGVSGSNPLVGSHSTPRLSNGEGSVVFHKYSE